MGFLRESSLSVFIVPMKRLHNIDVYDFEVALFEEYNLQPSSKVSEV